MAVTKEFNFQNFAGSYQLRIERARDLRAIPQLDEPFWVATSAPTAEILCDKALHKFLDADNDGRILSDDIRRGVAWLEERLTTLKGLDEAENRLLLEHLKTDGPGEALLTAARRILRNLDHEGDAEITLQQVRNHKAFNAQSIHNGDGIIPPEGTQDAAMQAFIKDILDTMGGADDLSGAKGVNLEKVDAFMKNALALLEWKNRADMDSPEHGLFPLGADTAAAHGKLSLLRAKIDEYFTLCDLQFLNRTLERATPNPACKEDVVVDSDAIKDYMAGAPLTRPTPDNVLDLEADLNPRFDDALRDFGQTVLKPLVPESEGLRMTQANWDLVKKAFIDYEAWQAAKTGGDVEKLGPDKLRGYADGPLPDALRQLINDDLSVGKELAAVQDLEYLILMQAWFLKICNNFISFPYLYDPEARAMFEVGRVVMDGRVFNFNVRVDNIDRHSAIAARSGIYLMYSEVTGPKPEDRFYICTPVTSHILGRLGVEKRGVLFDNDGRERDVRVIKVVDNPISLRNAVAKPFRRLGQLFASTLEKFTTSTEQQLQANITKTTTAVETGVKGSIEAPLNTPPEPKKEPTESERQNARNMIFGGGIAFAALGSSVAYITKTLAALRPEVILIAILVALAIILIPTILIADYKLAHRNLSGILEASGWAINTPMYMTRPMARIFAPKPVPPVTFGRLRRDMAQKFADQIEKRKRVLTFSVAGFFIIVVLPICGWFGYRAWARHQAETAQYPAPPADMVLVPAGSFIMGTDAEGPHVDPWERPARKEWLPAFYIDEYEVTNAEYQKVVPSWDFPPLDAKKPVTGITRAEAMDYAAKVGKRLPTNAEWERAARGTDGRIYPWGNHFKSGLAHIDQPDWGVNGKSRVGRYPSGNSPVGAYDMAGNVWEWVADDYYGPSFFGLVEPQHAAIVRGGAYSYRPENLTTFSMEFEGLNNTCNDVGFRCAMDAKPTGKKLRNKAK